MANFDSAERSGGIRYYPNGRRHEESARTDKYQKAQTLLKGREGDVAKGVSVSPAIGRLRFDDAAKNLVNDYTTNGKRMLKDAQYRLEHHLRPFFGEGSRRLTSLTTADVRAFSAERQAAGASNGEINRELALLKQMFTLAIQAGKGRPRRRR